MDAEGLGRKLQTAADPLKSRPWVLWRASQKKANSESNFELSQRRRCKGGAA